MSGHHTRDTSDVNGPLTWIKWSSTVATWDLVSRGPGRHVDEGDEPDALELRGFDGADLECVRPELCGDVGQHGSALDAVGDAPCTTPQGAMMPA